MATSHLRPWTPRTPRTCRSMATGDDPAKLLSWSSSHMVPASKPASKLQGPETLLFCDPFGIQKMELCAAPVTLAKFLNLWELFVCVGCYPWCKIWTDKACAFDWVMDTSLRTRHEKRKCLCSQTRSLTDQMISFAPSETILAQRPRGSSPPAVQWRSFNWAA